MKENLDYYNNLFDCYNSLLTENEKSCFLDYYCDDLSLQEIADNKSVSKNAIHKTIKNVIEKLEEYETKLHLLEIKNELRNLKEEDNNERINSKLDKLINL